MIPVELPAHLPLAQVGELKITVGSEVTSVRSSAARGVLSNAVRHNPRTRLSGNAVRSYGSSPARQTHRMGRRMPRFRLQLRRERSPSSS
jgi:hypothetical protein